MFQKKNLLIALIITLVAFSVFPQQKIKLKIASVAPARSPWDIEQRALAQEWSKITGGRVSVAFYDSFSLGGEKAVIQKFRSVRPGQKPMLDGAIFSTIGLNELAPQANIYTLSIPFLIRNQKELDLVLDTYGKDLIAEYNKVGFQMIAWTNVGWLSFYAKDPFNDLPSLKKIKIASAGLDSPILGDSFRASGFNVEDMPADKILQSLKSSGGVRGFFGVHLYAYVTGLSKSINYALEAKLCPVIAGLVISTDSWNEIPDQYKPAMLEAVDRMRKRLDAALEDTDRNYINSMKKEGVTFVSPTEKELSGWESDFSKDIDVIARAAPGAFSIPSFHKIQRLLAETRK